MCCVGWLCWGLTSQSTIFQSCRDGATASWVINQYFRGVKCLAQGHNTAAVGFEPPTSRSGVRHSVCCVSYGENKILNKVFFFFFSECHLNLSDELLGNKEWKVLCQQTLVHYTNLFYWVRSWIRNEGNITWKKSLKLTLETPLFSLVFFRQWHFIQLSQF